MAKNVQTQVEARNAVSAEKKAEKDSQIKQIKVTKSRASRRVKGVSVKKKTQINLDSKTIVIPSSGLYFKNFGVVSEERVSLYDKNSDYTYFQELSCNLDWIANSILGGEIDRLILKSEASKAIEKVLYMKEDGILFFIYGMFPDKQGYWILRQMTKELRNIRRGSNKKPKELEKIALDNISRKLASSVKFILIEYIKLEKRKIMTDKEIPPVDKRLRFDYFGMSYRSIGTISKLFGNDLEIDVQMDSKPSSAQMEDMKESLITAKIEAIAANTVANTGAIPVYLSVKLGYDKFRYLLFERLKNNYYLYMLAEGNLNKYGTIMERVIEMVEPITKIPFKGDLKPFIKLKKKITDFFQIRFF
ncbi:MAG: hypothetical protein ACTSWY_05585 [Promethearchaeota archaeon]